MAKETKASSGEADGSEDLLRLAVKHTFDVHKTSEGTGNLTVTVEVCVCVFSPCVREVGDEHREGWKRRVLRVDSICEEKKQFVSFPLPEKKGQVYYEYCSW